MEILKENEKKYQQEKTEDLNKSTILEKRKQKFSKKIFVTVIGIILLASFFGSLFGFMASKLTNFSENNFSEKKPENKQVINSQSLISEDSAVIEMVKKTSPAVVSITASKKVKNLKNLDFFGFGLNFSQDDLQNQEVGAGSGFLVSADGMIVTNKHVVEDSQASYSVTLNNDQEFPAKILAVDPIRDIAIVKIEGENFPFLSLGDSSKIQIGQTAIAIGNSLGEFSNTVSRGIISGLGRTVIAGDESGFQAEKLTDIIQTDAAINPGNSGGPLIDISGEVIGMNVAMAVGAQNIGFALPIDQVKKVVSQVKDSGKISTPFLGIRYVEISEEMKKENNLPFSYGVLVQRGSRVSELAVMPGSPADKAGIVENDIILEFNGQEINAENSLSDLIARQNVGDKIDLKIWNKGKEKNINVILEEKNQD